jgi:C4-dicarboxylate-specific signal transduction histidine kinase
MLDADHPISRHLKHIPSAAERAAGVTRQLLVFSRKQTVEAVELNVNKALHSNEEMLRRLPKGAAVAGINVMQSCLTRLTTVRPQLTRTPANRTPDTVLVQVGRRHIARGQGIESHPT